MHPYLKDGTLLMFHLKLQNKKGIIYVFCLPPAWGWFHLKHISAIRSINTLCRWVLLKLMTKSFI